MKKSQSIKSRILTLSVSILVITVIILTIINIITIRQYSQEEVKQFRIEAKNLKKINSVVSLILLVVL